MDFIRDLSVAFGKALMHTFFSVAFGFFQIAVVYFLCTISDDREFILQEFYDTGFFLFFTVAIISSAVTEYYFDARIKTNVYFDAFLLLSATGTVVFCMLVFSKIFLQLETTNELIANRVQDGFLVLGVTASLLLKIFINFKRP